jgi:hypothetical protein
MNYYEITYAGKSVSFDLVFFVIIIKKFLVILHNMRLGRELSI